MSRTLTILAALSLALPAAAQTTLHVPADHPTIQGAVDAAADGDTIEVKGGTYEEAVVVTGKTGLVIRAKGKVVLSPVTGTALTLDGCTEVSVEKIRVKGSDTYGIHLVDSTDCVLTKCRVEQIDSDAIRADGGGGHQFEKCTVKFAGNDGFALGAEELTSVDDCTFTKCKVQFVGGDGFDINGNGNAVDSCLVREPFDDGYEVDGTTVGVGNSFTACKVVKPDSSGFVVSGTDTTITECKAIQAGDFGVGIASGSGHLIQGCKIVKPAADGILYDDPVTGATLDGNKISKPEDDGLDIEGANVVATGNKVSGAGGSGYEISGTDGDYTGNSSAGAKGDGFLLAGTGNSLSLNKAKGSKGFDLFDTDPGANDVADDNIFGSTFP